MVEYPQLVNWLFYGMAGVIGMGILSMLRKLTASVDELNVKIAVLIEKTTHHERELARHDRRIEVLEQRD